MSQHQKILSLLRNAPNRRVTCREFAEHYIYHKASSRIGELEKRWGHVIEFTDAGTDSCLDNFYTLIHDTGADLVQMGRVEAGPCIAKNVKADTPHLATVFFKFDEQGQGTFA